MEDLLKERTVHTDEVVEVLGAWPIGRVYEVSFDALGTINQTWLVTAETGRYAIRLSGHDDVSKLERECDLLAYAFANGIPAIEPLKTTAGDPLLDRNGLWILSPFAPGFQVDRTEMTPEQDRGMGRYLAILLEGLAGCPHNLAARSRTLELDVDYTIRRMDELLVVVEQYPNPEECDRHAYQRLKARRQWVLDHGHESIAGLTDRPRQVIHGDYQERNVFFNEQSEIVALIDWDNAWLAPREWEIIRSINFVMFFDPERSQTFLDGYREVAPLDIEALDRAVWAYSVARSHDVWLFEEAYVRENKRTRQFFRPGGFTPPYEDWKAVFNRIR